MCQPHFAYGNFLKGETSRSLTSMLTHLDGDGGAEQLRTAAETYPSNPKQESSPSALICLSRNPQVARTYLREGANP